MASVLGLSRAEQERAKRLLRDRLYAHSATLLLGLVSLVLPDPWVYAAAVAAFVTEGAAWWLRSSGLDAHTLAEAGRRRALIERELGKDADSLGTALLTNEFSDWARQHESQVGRPRLLRDHWPSRPRTPPSCTPGKRVLVKSALPRSGSGELIRLCGILAIIVIAALLLGVVTAGSAETLAARAVTVAVGTLIAVDEVSVVLSLFGAARVAERVVRQLDTLQPDDLGQMLVVFADYSVATALGSPIPTRLYLAQHDRIDTIWHARSSKG